MSNLAIVDADRLLYLASHGKKIWNGNDYERDEKGNLVYEQKSFFEMIDSFEDTLKFFLNKCGTDRYVLCLSDPYTFRHKLYPQYKAPRREKPRPKYLFELKGYVMYKHPYLQIDGYEADDLVHTLAKQYKDSFILTNDKDILKGVGEISIYDCNKMCFIRNTKEEAEYNFAISMLMGDTSDNIPNAYKGMGPKTAEKLLKGVKTEDLMNTVLGVFVDKYGEAEGMYRFTTNYHLLKILDDIQIPDELITFATLPQNIFKWEDLTNNFLSMT